MSPTITIKLKENNRIQARVRWSRDNININSFVLMVIALGMGSPPMLKAIQEAIIMYGEEYLDSDRAKRIVALTNELSSENLSDSPVIEPIAAFKRLVQD